MEGVTGGLRCNLLFALKSATREDTRAIVTCPDGIFETRLRIYGTDCMYACMHTHTHTYKYTSTHSGRLPHDLVFLFLLLLLPHHNTLYDAPLLGGEVRYIG